MLNHIEQIDPKLYSQLSSLLTSGLVEISEGKTIDFSPVQTITIQNGKMTLNPPAKIKAKFGPVVVNTTLSEITKKPTGIRIDINNSPIDVELRPQ